HDLGCIRREPGRSPRFPSLKPGPRASPGGVRLFLQNARPTGTICGPGFWIWTLIWLRSKQVRSVEPWSGTSPAKGRNAPQLLFDCLILFPGRLPSLTFRMLFLREEAVTMAGRLWG